MSLGIDAQCLMDFFTSANDVLCPWFTHLELPDFVMEGIRATVHSEGMQYDIEAFDRLVIYTDGSSKPHNRRKAPLFVADTDQPESWAFAVIGEKYPSSVSNGTLTFLGWQAQQVMYENDNRAFTGTDQIGAEYAEREAFIFAGLWRLALNTTIPTVFRTDSSTTAKQATGEAGFQLKHPTLEILRGVFQAMSSGLPEAALEVSHVKGHTGDIWNEFVDTVAKSEAAKGHHLQRQNLNLPVLKDIIPHLWLLTDPGIDLPKFDGVGIGVDKPILPPVHLASSPAEDTVCITPDQNFSLSLATLNVGSLFLSPEGFSGKLSYLRQQMKGHGLHILGIQEARSPEGCSTAEDVIRISGGADKGNLGVEVWISMTQPICQAGGKSTCIRRSDVQLLHHDPRRILLRLDHEDLRCFIVALHGPQSGRPLHERSQWLVCHHGSCDNPLYWTTCLCIDGCKCQEWP